MGPRDVLNVVVYVLNTLF